MQIQKENNEEILPGQIIILRDLGAASRHYEIFPGAPALDLNSKPKIPCHLKIVQSRAVIKVVTHNFCYSNSLHGRRPKGRERGKDDCVKSEKISCRRTMGRPFSLPRSF